MEIEIQFYKNIYSFSRVKDCFCYNRIHYASVRMNKEIAHRKTFDCRFFYKKQDVLAFSIDIKVLLNWKFFEWLQGETLL